ncbi:nucleotidyltransferase substrate binding protein, HI0074 family [Thermosyntropha lipolytica DSM 11003]|uniref:Nucleotidyltransferase substrate binding protein, HI0074 family n=1 Tax=Thermosyntropha lipolytica DSM 11003 TaxID=1123382 RepID=A0A1M5K1U3_9FIRM|nr:nucleotidyltransferase substrate binding protein [Thermosyntropha lipolytica]SHG46744.1 nucleotidyltransferase substrate binding protein, HI0074 family [Thermosyntropha lipolytica DSM 11003]
MSQERLKEKFAEYKKAVYKLKEALEEDVSNPLLYDGVIQRFEFTYELAWKLMKLYLESEGIVTVNSPRSAFKEAFAVGIITEGETWIDMINARNLTVHTYNEQMAKEIYDRVKDKYYPVFFAFANKMGEKIK